MPFFSGALRTKWHYMYFLSYFFVYIHSISGNWQWGGLEPPFTHQTFYRMSFNLATCWIKKHRIIFDTTRSLNKNNQIHF